MFFAHQIKLFSFLTLLSLLISSNLSASVMKQEGWEAWYQSDVVHKTPEPYKGFMNPAGARFICDEVRTACFNGPSFAVPPLENHPTYLTNVFNANLSPFPIDPITSMIRAFFPCPEGVLFVPAQASSNPLTPLSCKATGELLNFLVTGQNLTPLNIYDFIHKATGSKTPGHILDKSRVLQGGRALFGNKVLALLKELFDATNEMLAAEPNNKKAQKILQKSDLQRLQEIAEDVPEMKQFFNGGLEEAYYQNKAHQEYKSLAQELNNKRIPVNRLREKLKKSKTQSLSVKDQEALQRLEQELADVENHRQTLLQKVPDIHALENEPHYYLSQVAHLIYDSWMTRDTNIFGPNLFAKTFMAYAYSKAQTPEDVLGFFEGFLNTSLSKDSPQFRSIKPFNKERYEWLKAASQEDLESGKARTLENASLFLYGQKAFEEDARDLQFYSTANFENKSFPNCVETTVLNLLVLLGQRGENLEVGALPGDPIPALREFIEKYKTPEMMNGQSARDDFAAMVSNIPGIKYEKATKVEGQLKRYEIFSGFKNTYNVLAYLLNTDNIDAIEQSLTSNPLTSSPSPSDDEGESQEESGDASDSEDADQLSILGEAALKKLFGDDLETIDGEGKPIGTTGDYKGSITLKISNGREYVWGATDRHAFIEEKVGVGPTSIFHPLFNREEMVPLYPEFSDQLSVQGLAAPVHPTEMFPVPLSKANAWAVAAGLKNSKELKLWYAHALLTQGPEELRPLGIKFLSNLVEDGEWHLMQYLGQLNHLKAISKEVLRELIIQEPEGLSIPIGPFAKTSEGNFTEVAAATPILHFLDDPEIMDIARRELQTVSNYKSSDPSVDPVYLEWINTQTQKLLEIITADDKPWKIRNFHSITLGTPREYEYKIPNLKKFLANMPKLQYIYLDHHNAPFAPEAQDVIETIRFKHTVFQCNAMDFNHLQTLISWAEANPHLQEPMKRKFVVDFSRHYWSAPGDEKTLTLLTPEALAYYQSLDKPMHSNLFIQYNVKTDDTTSTSKVIDFKEFFKKDNGEFAKNMLYLVPVQNTP